MKKTIKLLSPVFILMLLLLPFPNEVEALNGGKMLKTYEPQQAIVQIYTYYLNESNNLKLLKTGSGAIIDESGTVLTNHHVVDNTDELGNDQEVAFWICLTTYKTDEPPYCHYSADLLAKDEDDDIALLKIRPVLPGTQTFFDYLGLATAGEYKSGTAVRSLGYPAAGGPTITISDGTITGTLEENDSVWIKHSAFTGPGSSGGPLILESGRIIGIVTAINGDLGYAKGVIELNDWIRINSENKARNMGNIKYRMDEFIKVNYDILDQKDFSNDAPNFSLRKFDSWEFRLLEENSLYVNDNNPGSNAYLNINWFRSSVNMESQIESIKKQLMLMFDCYSASNSTVAGRTAFNLKCEAGDEELDIITLAVNNYYFIIYSYDNSLDTASQAIDKVLESLQISGENSTALEQKSYEHASPYFRLNLSHNWALMDLNSEVRVVSGSSKSVPEAGFVVHIDKLSENSRNLSNSEYYEFIKVKEEVKVSNEEVFPLKAEVYYKNLNFSYGNIKNQMVVKYKFKDELDNSVKFLAAAYLIRTGDRLITIEFDYVGEDIDMFENYVSGFERDVLSNFSLGESGTPVVNQTNSQIENSAETPAVSNQNQVQTNSADLSVRQINNIGKRLMGRILLQVESRGEAWYLSPKSNKAYYLGRQEDAYQIMREEGVGITNNDLERIPIGLVEMTGIDSDNDGLSDLLEDALGSDVNNSDTDGDGINDKEEVEKGYFPTSDNRRQPVSSYFANSQKGKIFLQVEAHGEAWYVNPVDGKRYFLGRAGDAYQIMRLLSLGISDNDLEKL